MATYSTQRTQAYGTVTGVGAARTLVVDGCSVALTTGMIDNANDEIELLYVPAGAVIVGAELRCTDVDTNVSPGILWDVGDDVDEDRLIAAATVGQTLSGTTALAAAGFMYKYASKTKIKAYVNTASATGAAGTLYFRITYFVDPNFSLANAVV